MQNIKARLIELIRNEEGASALEYVVMAAMVAAFIATTFSTSLQGAINTVFTNIITAMTP